MDCVHFGRKLAIRSRQYGDPIEVHQCHAKDGPCVRTIEELTQMPGSTAISCEGCPLFRAAKSESEVAFAGEPWGRGESLSGPGSSLDATETIRRKLPMFLWSLFSRPLSLLDIPCGDHHWMARMIERNSEGWQDADGQPKDFDVYFGSSRMSCVSYIGADVVRDVVESNRAKWPNRDFRHLDITADTLPTCDVVFVRDCLVHLPYEMIRKALSRIVESGAKWLITTHFPGRTNHDIPLGSWRPLDLTAKPFYLPKPDSVINENCTEGGGAYADKSLGVWSIDAIRESVEAMNSRPKLTIGMAYYRDWPGLWATIESLRLHHSDVMRDVEIVVVDNDLQGKPDETGEKNHSWKAKSLCEQIGGKYEHFTAVAGTAAAKGRIFEVATAPAVLVVDCHVMFPPGTIRRLIDWFDANPESRDMLQGPLIVGDQTLATHMVPTWGSLMRGQWATDHDWLRLGVDAEPKEIGGHGCGLFAMRRKAWPGFHPLLKGFGPEEFHIHARVRRNGGKCYSMPWLRWSHRFGNPDGHAIAGMRAEDRLRGHVITHLDTGEYSLEEIRRHFVTEQGMDGTAFDKIVRRTQREMATHTAVPSLMVRGINFGLAILRWMRAGKPVCTEQQIADRFAICRSCPHFENGGCKLCGCPTNGDVKWRNKLALATESCPEGKWAAITDSQ